MTSVQTYQRPSSVEEAWSLLDEGGKNAMLIGGGVDVGLFSPPEIHTLIDLTRLPYQSIDLNDNGLVIGAGVTLTEMLESRWVADTLDGVVVTMLRQVASPLLRNAATVGGAVASTHPWSDVITLLLALDASVTRYAGQFETVSLAELLEQRGTIDRAIITEVILPVTGDRTFAGFEKFVRTGFDVGMLNCACRITAEDDGCQEVRIVFGGAPDIARRMEAVERALTGVKLDHAGIEAAAVLAAEVLPARDDVRASAEYRRILAATGVRRCLTRIAQRLGE